MNTKSSKSAVGQQRSRKAAGSVIKNLCPDIVSRMARSVAQARSSGEAIREHLIIVQELSQSSLVFLSEFDPGQRMLCVAAVRGRVDKTVVAAKLGEGPVGQAFVTQAMVEDDATSHVAIPLFESDQPFGVLSLVGSRRRATEAVWKAVAGHLVAAKNAALSRDVALRRNRDLETAVAGLRSLERARDELLGNVSHELKSPLTTIKAYLAMARKNRLGELNDKQKHAFEVCDRNADRLLRLINDMLLMTRLAAERMSLATRPIGLRSIVQEALGSLAPLASMTHVSLELERGTEVFVKGDADRLLEAVAHLVENAVIYNRAGGEVKVRVHAAAGVACLEVKDNGEGIPPDELHHIFERFYKRSQSRSHSAGAGLGLAIVRQIARLHGGTAVASSVPDEGSIFSLRLPLFAGAVSSSISMAEPRDGAILVVEDDDDCREVLVQVLESEGLNVMQASDSNRAIQILCVSKPELVLLDLRLGDSNGRLVLQHLRYDPRLAHTPVFVISGAADSPAGFCYDGPEHIDGFFEKPLNLERLLSRVHEVVRPLDRASST